MTDHNILLYLGIGWFLWCCAHSLLINKGVQHYIVQWFARRKFAGFRYRLFYTIVAFATLLPLVLLTWSWRGAVVYAWHGGWYLLELGIAALALWLFRAGARKYDLHEMVYGKDPADDSKEDVEFSREGVHGLIRHPWYLGSLLFLWAWPVYHQGTLVAALILSCYLLIGTLIEERRLVAQFGDDYRQYQREVSMLFPLKWLSKKMVQKLRRRNR